MGHRLRTTASLVASVAALFVLVGAPAAGASSAGDLKTAKQGVLVASDFPAGWSGTPSRSTPDAKVIKQASALQACKDYVVLRKMTLHVPKAHSSDFSDGSTAKMSNVVNALASTGKAAAAVKLFAKSGMADCLRQITQKAVGSKATVTVDAADMSGLTADAVGYTARIADGSGTVQDQLLTFAVPINRYIAVYTVEVQSADAPLDALDAAVSSSLTRLTAAAG